MDRRDLVRLLALSPLPALLGVRPAVLEQAVRTAREASAPGAVAYEPRFFSAEEWETVRLLADLIIPRDERSGSATEAGVPEFMDWVIAEYPSHQTPIRGGLAWLDRECRGRWGRPFRALGEADRRTVLDAIAWPDRATDDMRPGVAFFNRFRDLVAAGFWSSRMGVEDLGYQGNTFVTQWTGCPDAQLERYRVRRD